METTVESSDEPKTRRKRIRLFIGQLSWRMLLMRLVINSLTLILVALLVPDIYFVDRSLLSILFMAAVLGILNAFVKPLIQFLTLQFIFATYGFVVVLINTIILLLLDLIFQERFYVGRMIWAIVGGLVMGVVSSFLESLLGLNLPIVPETELPQGKGTIPQAGSRIISSMLAEDEEVAAGEDALEPTETIGSTDPSAVVADDKSEQASESTSEEEEEPAPAHEEGASEARADADDEQQGDAR